MTFTEVSAKANVLSTETPFFEQRLGDDTAPKVQAELAVPEAAATSTVLTVTPAAQQVGHPLLIDEDVDRGDHLNPEEDGPQGFIEEGNPELQVFRAEPLAMALPPAPRGTRGGAPVQSR